MKSQNDPGRSKSRHHEYSLILPIIALVILNIWGDTSNFAAVIVINMIALVGILSSAFSVVRHADVLAHRLGEPYGSLILSLSVVVLEVSLISAMMATGDAAPALMRDTLYSIIMIVIGGLVGVSLLLGGRKFATQHVNLVGIKQYLMAIFPLAIIVLVLPSTLPDGNFSVAQSLVVAAISAAMYGVFLLIQTKTHQSLFVYEHEDEGDDPSDPHHGKPSSHSSLWHTFWLLIHLVAVIAVTKFDANPLEALLTELNAPAKFTGFLIALLILSPEGLGIKSSIGKSGAARDEPVLRLGAGHDFPNCASGNLNCRTDWAGVELWPGSATYRGHGQCLDSVANLILYRQNQRAQRHRPSGLVCRVYDDDYVVAMD